MALIPHKITALAESDAQGTGGKNIIAGAVVSLFDEDNNAVILFDNEAGANGSTTKTTDSTGQVVVYVTPGEYEEQINSGTRRKVSIFGNSTAVYATTADLAAARPVTTGLRAENTERANAQYILADAGYTALPGDITAANGRVWELQIDGVCNIKWLGAVGDGVADDTNSITGGITRSKSVFLPEGSYRITSQIEMPMGCTLFGLGSMGNILQGSSSKVNAGNAVIFVDFGAGFEDLGVGVTSSENRTTYFANSAILLNTGCTITGLAFHYPNQNMLNNDTVANPPTKYAPTITVNYLAEATSITGINIGNCYVGIDARKQHNGCRIQNIYGSPLSIGIRTGSTTGFDDLQNINFVLGNSYEDPIFPANGIIDWVGKNGVCIEQNRSTWIKISNMKTFGYNIGVNIFASDADIPNGLTQTDSGQTCTYEGCGFDFCAYGIKGSDTFYLSIVACSFTPKHKDQSLLADTYAIYIDNFGSSEYNITVANCSVHDADYSAFYFEGVNNLNVSNNQIEELSMLKAGTGITVINCDQAVISANNINGKDKPNTTGIFASNARSVSIVNNALSDIQTPIEIKDLEFSSIQGNMGESNPSDLIFDTSDTPVYSNILINNVGNTINTDTTDDNVDANGILNIDLGRSFVSHSGNNNIKGLTSGYIGQLITLRFGSTASTNGLIDQDAATPQPNRFYMPSDYAFSFSDTIQFVSRGPLGWYEVARSVN